MEDNTYIEIKGYETDKDKAKYSSLNNVSMMILKSKELKNIFEYVINKYGKDFIKLYEK